MADDTPLARAEASLKRIQDFDVETLIRVKELGMYFNFEGTVKPANRLIALFQKIPLESLKEFSDDKLEQIWFKTNSALSLFDQIINIDMRDLNMKSHRNIIADITNEYQKTFNEIMPIVSYGAARTFDFRHFQTEGEQILKEIKDQANEGLAEIEALISEASSTLEEIRKISAEKGVSQQAEYFSEEADNHTAKANGWMCITFVFSGILLFYGLGSFFIHKIPWIAPESTPEAISFVASKILIFIVLTYMLVLSARNFLSHKHNAVVNKHRQNALVTFNALVKAGQGKETQDIVLSHASSCIFSPQDTGYTKHGGANSAPVAKVIDGVQKATFQATE